MLVMQILLIAILALSPRYWFRWWQDSRFTAYAWGMLAFMASTALIYLNFGELAWGRIFGLFGFVLALSVARLLYARKRLAEKSPR